MGLDAGLVFTTYRMSAISWALLALAIAGGVPWWLGSVYALGFLAPLTMALNLRSLHSHWDDGTGLARYLARRTDVARIACVTVLVITISMAAS